MLQSLGLFCYKHGSRNEEQGRRIALRRRRGSVASTPVCRLKKLKDFCLCIFVCLSKPCLKRLWMYVSPPNLKTCHQNPCSLCFGMQVFVLILVGLHPDSLLWKKRMHKTASLCHRKQELGLFGMQRIVFPCHHFPSKPLLWMQTLMNPVSFVHPKPWLLPEMDAGLLL